MLIRMNRGLSLLSIVLVLGGCAGDDTSAGTDPSSESGTPESSSDAGSMTDPTMTSADSSSGSTTCDDDCTTSGTIGDTSTTDPDGSTTGTSVASSSSSSDGPEESSSSEGPMGVCGNGAVENGEDCDDSGESATCDDDCTAVDCGDENVNELAGEVCDEGGESFNCDSDCTEVECGDGIVNESHDEICDDGGPTATCDPDCTAPLCGDGVQNIATLESCDDGNNASFDGCSSNCVVEGDFGGECRIVDGTQWCFDRDHCGQACEDVCSALGLTIEPNDGVWFAAQDTAGECQAIADAFQMSAPIQFDAAPLGCLEDTGGADLTGGDLTGGLACSSDPTCPGQHRTDMDDLGLNCDLPGSRRSVCPCAGAFCGNGVVEGTEICDDGNEVNNDGCNSHCTTGPTQCETGVDPGNGAEYVVCSADGDTAWISGLEAGGAEYHAEAICIELGYTGIGEHGGTCGSVCGFCEMIESSCDANGEMYFDDGGTSCGSDELGEILCYTVHWTCV
jgi:cysteine-rich repeat protein